MQKQVKRRKEEKFEEDDDGDSVDGDVYDFLVTL